MFDLASRIGRARSPGGLQDAAENVVWDAEPTLREASDTMQRLRWNLELAISDDWADAFVWIDASAAYLDAVCDFLAGRDETPEAVRRAQFEVCRRAAGVAHEVLALLRAGFPDGAHARWRTLYELAVVAHVLASGNRGTASRYLAHRMLVAHDRIGDLVEDPALSTEAAKIRRRFTVPFKGDYGWACELSGRRLSVSHPRLHHLERLVGDNTARLEDLKRLAQHHVHAGSLGNVLAKTTPDPPIADPWRLAPVAAATADAAAEVGVAATVACMRYGNRVPRVLRGLHHLGIELSLMGSHVLGMHLELPHLNRMAADE